MSAVAKANVDPLPILDLTDCVQELRRSGIPLPERGPWDTDEIYRGMCQEVCTHFLSVSPQPISPGLTYPLKYIILPSEKFNYLSDFLRFISFNSSTTIIYQN